MTDLLVSQLVSRVKSYNRYMAPKHRWSIRGAVALAKRTEPKGRKAKEEIHYCGDGFKGRILERKRGAHTIRFCELCGKTPKKKRGR